MRGAENSRTAEGCTRQGQLFPLLGAEAQAQPSALLGGRLANWMEMDGGALSPRPGVLSDPEQLLSRQDGHTARHSDPSTRAH